MGKKSASVTAPATVKDIVEPIKVSAPVPAPVPSPPVKEVIVAPAPAPAPVVYKAVETTTPSGSGDVIAAGIALGAAPYLVVGLGAAAFAGGLVKKPKAITKPETRLPLNIKGNPITRQVPLYNKPISEGISEGIDELNSGKITPELEASRKNIKLTLAGFAIAVGGLVVQLGLNSITPAPSTKPASKPAPTVKVVDKPVDKEVGDSAEKKAAADKLATDKAAADKAAAEKKAAADKLATPPAPAPAPAPKPAPTPPPKSAEPVVE